MSDSKRLEPQTPDEWSDDTRRLLGGTTEPVAKLEGRAPGAPTRPLNILATIAHHPRLLEPFLRYSATLAIGGVLPRRASELLALRAAWNCQSDFEWGHHVVYALSSGLDSEEVDRVALGPSAQGWNEEDRLLLVAADELHRDQDLGDDTWQQLSARWDEAQLLEIPFIVGHYTMLSMVAKTTGVPLEDGLQRLPTDGTGSDRRND